MAAERKQLDEDRKRETEALHHELEKLRQENEKLKKLEETRAANVEQQAREEVHSIDILQLIII